MASIFSEEEEEGSSFDVREGRGSGKRSRFEENQVGKNTRVDSTDDRAWHRGKAK